VTLFAPTHLRAPDGRCVVAAGLLSLAALSACASGPQVYTPGQMTSAQFERCRAVAQAYIDRSPAYASLRDALRGDAVASRWFVRYLEQEVIGVREGQAVLIAEEKVRVDAIRKLRKETAGFDLPSQRRDRRAIMQIVAMGEPAVEVVVQDLLKSRQEFLRSIGVEVLTGLGDLAVPALLEMVRSGDVSEQLVAARALGAVGATGSALDALRELTGSPRWRVRSTTVQALAGGGVRARALLLRMLSDEDEFVRRKAAEALGNYRDAVAADALVSFLERSKDRNEWSCELAAQKALQQIAGSKGPRSAVAWRSFVDQLREGGGESQHGR